MQGSVLEELRKRRQQVSKRSLEQEYVESTGLTPLEYLCIVYRDPDERTLDRMNAAKAVLEYAHKKLPSEIETNVTGKISLDNVKNLSNEELSTLMTLIEKASGG